ncbi:MAG: DUF3352 domain-containing protein [Cytophagales bacterium]|nr:DUF3352 domain-containing protein [Cytophagales bacterium]
MLSFLPLPLYDLPTMEDKENDENLPAAGSPDQVPNDSGCNDLSDDSTLNESEDEPNLQDVSDEDQETPEVESNSGSPLSENNPSVVSSQKRRKRFLPIALIAVGALIASWFIYRMVFPVTEGPRINPLNLVPADAFFIMETDQAYGFWSKIGKTQIWKTLTKDEDWKAYGEHLTALEETLADFDQLLEKLNHRKVYVSGHLYYKGNYDYLFLLDMQGLALPRTYLTSQSDVTKRTFLNHTIYEQLDEDTNETLHFTFIDNYWIGSYTHTLIESSITNLEKAELSRSFNFIEVRKKAMGEGVARLYFNYDNLFPYLKTMTDPSYIDVLKENLPLYHTGSYFDVEESSLLLEGYSNYNDSLPSYLPIFEKAGTGSLNISEVLPSNTALYFSLGFRSFADFYGALDEQLRSDTIYGENYIKYTRRTEKFLNIDLQKDFASWLDDELAVVQLEATSSEPELALVFKAKGNAVALEKMAFLSKQIKKRTPVRFKQVDYRGYPINFMSVKGIFNLVLGKLFQYFDRPYYTIIDEYIVFSNQPSILRRFIDEYEAGNTLARVPSFQSFKEQIGEKHSALCYLQLPLLEHSAGGMIDSETLDFLKNKRNIVADFPQMAFQLTPERGIYQTRILVSIDNMDQPIPRRMEPTVLRDTINYDSLWNIDPGEQVEITALEIELDDLGAKKQTESTEDGTPIYEVNIKDGLKHGNYFEYHETGELKIKGKYKKDLKQGTWRYYDVAGNLVKKEKWKDGVMQ